MCMWITDAKKEKKWTVYVHGEHVHVYKKQNKKHVHKLGHNMNLI